jgi:hypothetical protein
MPRKRAESQAVIPCSQLAGMYTSGISLGKLKYIFPVFFLLHHHQTHKRSLDEVKILENFLNMPKIVLFLQMNTTLYNQ